MNSSIIKLAQSSFATTGVIAQCSPVLASQLHTSAPLCRVVSGKYRITKKRDKPLTYEMANPPHYIAHRKSWNSWNTSTMKDGLRRSETALEDEFIRRFMSGTWHGLVCSERVTQFKYLGHIVTEGLTDDYDTDMERERRALAVRGNMVARRIAGCSVIIKRQFNHIRVAAIIRRAVSPTKMYFLLGYTEELLANWLQCPVTLELQTVDSFKDVVFKYI